MTDVMQYFRNYEVARMYGVSQAAVGKWVTSANEGNLKLELIKKGAKHYIANTPKNLVAIEGMVKDRKKYLNTRSLKQLVPAPKFYELYSQEQILDIISNIEIHRELPLQYSYFNGGAVYWDNYSRRLITENTPNLVNSTIDLLKMNKPFLDDLLSKYKKVNVIDIGVGNGDPARDLLVDLQQRGVLGRYVGIDISQEMLNIAEANLNEYVGGNFKFEGYIRDINYDRFVDILSPSSLKSEESVNIVLFLGGTLCNFRTPTDILRVIYNSMGKDDKIIYSGLLDSPSTRLHFDFDEGPGRIRLDRQLPDLLNIDRSHYDAEELYDEKLDARLVYIRFKVAVSIKFSFEEGERRVDLGKGERLLIYRHYHFDLMDTLGLLDSNGFNMLQVSRATNRDYFLAISEIKTEQLKTMP